MSYSQFGQPAVSSLDTISLTTEEDPNRKPPSYSQVIARTLDSNPHFAVKKYFIPVWSIGKDRKLRPLLDSSSVAPTMAPFLRPDIEPTSSNRRPLSRRLVCMYILTFLLVFILFALLLCLIAVLVLHF